MLSGRRILFAPLDWGMGHATRSVPVIRQLLGNGNSIVLGITPLTAPLLTQEFPNLETVQLPAYDLRYSSIWPLWIKLIADWPRISGVMREENKCLSDLVRRLNIEVVISDSRFGLWTDQAHTVLISHQLFLKAPVAAGLAQRINRKFLLRFDELWVPDHADLQNSLAGELSHGPHFHPRVTYIGPQSRLQRVGAAGADFDGLFLVSGPAPQNRVFADQLSLLARRLPHLKFAAAGMSSYQWPDHVVNFSFANSAVLSDLFMRSALVICRSGYSSLMDADRLGIRNLVLVPTPGQSEQEYLARYWQQHYESRVCQQRDLHALSL